MPINYVQTHSDLNEFLRCEALVLYFTAAWCGPCQAIAPMIEQLYTQYTTVEIAKVDLDKHREIASKYSITAVPTFVFLHKGKEVERVRGASTQAVLEGLKKLSALAPHGKRRDVGEDSSSSLSSVDKQLVATYVPKGFTLLNKTVQFGEFECLNATQSSEKVKGLLKLDEDSKISTDADSQLLIHIPFTNICKVSSLVIKSTSGQRPNLIKVWANRSSILGFDDATTINALHQEDIGQFNEDGCVEIKLKYVRFQKVTSLTLFFDGEDEDESTTLDKILIVGVDGESKTQGNIEKIGDDE